MNEDVIPSMMFHPASSEEVIKIVEALRNRYPKLYDAGTPLDLLRDARNGYCPGWFTVSDDQNLDYYIYYGSGNVIESEVDFRDPGGELTKGYFFDYPVIAIEDFLAGRVTDTGKVRHIHADLIEWFMASVENRVEFQPEGSNGWFPASAPNWRTTSKYRKLDVSSNPRPQQHTIVAWANDQSLMLQVKRHSGWVNVDDGDTIDVECTDLRVTTKELTELEKQAASILANPELMELIKHQM